MVMNLATKENLQALKDRQAKRDSDIVLLLQREIDEVTNDLLVTRLMYQEAEHTCIEGAIFGMDDNSSRELAMKFKSHMLMLEQKQNDLKALIATYKMESVTREKPFKDLASMASEKAKNIGEKVNKENIENIGKSIFDGVQGFVDMLKNVAEEAAETPDEKDTKNNDKKSSGGIKIEIQ